MHLKRYRRQTVKEALRAVREDLGPDALVLSTRTVTALGVRGLFGAKEIEITAAAERFALSEDRHALTGGRPEMRAGSEIAARFEAGGMDPALAREIAAAHPATPRRGPIAQRRDLAGDVPPARGTVRRAYAPRALGRHPGRRGAACVRALRGRAPLAARAHQARRS